MAIASEPLLEIASVGLERVLCLYLELLDPFLSLAVNGVLVVNIDSDLRDHENLIVIA